jgi:hypothetical protein
MQVKWRTRYLIISVVILIATAVALFYAGWIADRGGNPDNQVLANAAQFASMVTAAIAILISAYAISLEARRADERDETAPVAWNAALRLAHAIYAFDWTLVDIGPGVSPAADDRRRGQYQAAVNELDKALTLAARTLVGRSLGITWSAEGTSDLGGMPTTAVLTRLRGEIRSLKTHGALIPDASTLAALNCVYRSIAQLDAERFRELWETGMVSPSLALKDRVRILDWGDDLFAINRILEDDLRSNRPGTYWMGVTVPMRTTLLGRARLAARYGYARKVSAWWSPAPRLHDLDEESWIAGMKAGMLWGAAITPQTVNGQQLQAVRVTWGLDNDDLKATDTDWFGVLGRTMVAVTEDDSSSYWRRPTEDESPA